MFYDNIYLALECLVGISEKRQNQLRESVIDEKGEWNSSYVDSPKRYAKEFCTIKCGTCRRGGHDYGTAELIAKRNWTVVQVAPNYGITRILEEELKNHKGGKIELTVTPVNCGTKLIGRNLNNIDAVIFTCANAFSANELDYFYTTFAHYFLLNKKTFFFIHVQ